MGNKRLFTLTKTEWKSYLALPDTTMNIEWDSRNINAEKCGRDSTRFWKMKGRKYGFDWTTVGFRKELTERAFLAVPLSFEQKLTNAIVRHDEGRWMD